MLRLVLIFVALLLTERAADACCVGCACTQYKHRQLDDQVQIIQEVAPGYTHSARGALPAWSIARIAKFLQAGTWRPHPTAMPKGAARPVTVRIVPAPPIRFLTADAIDDASPSKAQTVLIRRIEKHGRAILVEVDDRTYKLAACPTQPGFVCLLPPGKLALRPIPPPGQGFAQPPN